MGNPTGFLEHRRLDPPPGVETDGMEAEGYFAAGEMETQASRCLDCGLPYCHAFGCPLGSRIPDWNEMLFRGQWRRALEIIHQDNNFPEFTGRLCPAPCESACTLALQAEAVTTRQGERHLVEEGWRRGWIRPYPSPAPSGRRVAVIGSGPSGLASAQELARSGHRVVVFEKSDRPGGLLRYGIADFKLAKFVLDRRLEQMTAEGVIWESGVEVGRDVSFSYLRRAFDAAILATGSGLPRDLKLPGRELSGVAQAMDYLVQENLLQSGRRLADQAESPAGKRVVVIGGGDTGDDCVESCRRAGAAEVRQIEILPRPAVKGGGFASWPLPPPRGAAKDGEHILWAVSTRSFRGENGRVSAVVCSRLDYPDSPTPRPGDGRPVPGSEFEIPAEMVILALGFEKASPRNLMEEKSAGRGSDGTPAGLGNGVFAAGDLILGPSLVARAIASGRFAAAAAERYLRDEKP